MMWDRCIGVLASVVIGLASLQGSVAHAAVLGLKVQAAGRSVLTVESGTRIAVSAARMPRGTRPYCLGLASMLDRGSLPLNLGPLTRDKAGVGRAVVVIPKRLIPAEPAGPYLLFVGSCASVAPDGPILAQTTIQVVGRRG